MPAPRNGLASLAHAGDLDNIQLELFALAPGFRIDDG
jgi:hypothetical protein